MGDPRHYCGECKGKMKYDKDLSVKSKGITGWWCMNCDLVEIVSKHKVHNAVTSARRFVFFGKLGRNN